MKKTRCGECSECIEAELNYLVRMESALWKESTSDITFYLNLVGTWIDLFNERGLPW